MLMSAKDQILGFSMMSPLKHENAEVKEMGQNGIGSVLDFSTDPMEHKSMEKSLRRCFSADMMSERWKFQPSLKKVASCRQISVHHNSFSEFEEGEEENEIKEPGGQLDIWTMIQSKKPEKDSLQLPPYVHPLVKRSSSSLSQKSLEICTESLGSETGSFASQDTDFYLKLSELKEEQRLKKLEKEEQFLDTTKESGAVDYITSITRKSPPRAFPPPLQSISRVDGPRLRMKSHRRDGRLLLEAVPVPTHSYFHAERKEGRLLLSFVNNPHQEDNGLDEDVSDKREDRLQNIVNIPDENKQRNHVEDVHQVFQRGLMLEVKLKTHRMMEVHRAALVMDRLAGVMPYMNRNPWATKLKKKLNENDKDTRSPLPMATINAYEYCWRNTQLSPALTENSVLKKKMEGDNKNVNMSVPVPPQARRCEEPRRTLLIFKSYCIATS